MDNFKESKQVQWEAIKKDDNYGESSSSFYSSGLSSSSSSTDDDASSSFNSYPPSGGPLYDLADLIAQLPIKRGLSKFYNGKSQTFASLSNLNGDEDLGKKEMSGIRQRMKSCKSYGGNLNQQHKVGLKATIKKRSPKILYSWY
ncbi:hypothetical protein ACS0TY_025068 [Phlomoides rotata]